MNDESENPTLGYVKHPDGNWEPIAPLKDGYIYSSAMITCSRCGKFIRSMGGPMYGCVCVHCYIEDLRANKETD